MNRSGFLAVCVAVVLSAACIGGATAAPAAGAYPKTIEALQQRYIDEVTAHQKYHAYAQRADEEGYPNVAYLFRALAASESVHARNFKRLLEQLGGEVPKVDAKFEVTDTQEHLQRATAVEADEIDREYPAILERIRPEGNEEAIRFITYAWQAEKQHRDLIVKIRKASKRWFGFLIDRIEGEPTHYYVCQVCGSTLTEIPASCPICGEAGSHYVEVPGFPGPRQPESEDEEDY